MAKIKEHKLDSEIKHAVKFINGTVGIFKVIGNKIGVTVTSLIDVLGFTFMSVPVLNTLKSLAAEQGFTIDNVEQMLTGFLLSAGTYLVKNILKKKL